MTDDGYMKMEELIQGGAYRIRSRNLAYGVWDAGRQGFVGIREKFNNEYLDTEFHYDTGAPYGTARPEEFMGMCPVMDLAEYHSRCDEGRDVRWQQQTGLGPRGEGWWTHVDDGSVLPNPDQKGEPGFCQNFAYKNEPLFGWLKELEATNG